jgi:hypothetical protein
MRAEIFKMLMKNAKWFLLKEFLWYIYHVRYVVLDLKFSCMPNKFRVTTGLPKFEQFLTPHLIINVAENPRTGTW